MFSADMNHFQSDNYDENESDVEPQIFAEHRDKDGNVHVGENEEDKNKNDDNVYKSEVGPKQADIPDDNKNEIDKTENLGQTKKNKKK